MDWRSWLYEVLSADAALLALLPQPSPESWIFGAGSLVAPPSKRPFLVIKMEPKVPGPFRAVSNDRAALWAHDEPGDYLRLDAVLSAVRARLSSADGSDRQVARAGAVAARWQGDSADLSDPDFGTITRNSTYDLLGRT